MDVNTKGVFLCRQEAIARMRKHKGTVKANQYGFFPRRTRAPGNRRRLALPAQVPPALTPPAEIGRDGKVAASD